MTNATPTVEVVISLPCIIGALIGTLCAQFIWACITHWVASLKADELKEKEQWRAICARRHSATSTLNGAGAQEVPE